MLFLGEQLLYFMDSLFDNIRFNLHHVLHKLLPSKTDRIYNLRLRRRSYFLLTVMTDCHNLFY